jgi:hypothetical protein
MNNEIDLLDELEREERDERLAAGGGGAGAALGVLLTFVIGCGLVFAAYKLGQRKTVDEPPMIAANDTPIKSAPEDAGGSVIPNTDSYANTMIDGSRPAASDFALRDGVVVEANLPDRAIDAVASSAETREIRREVTQLTDLEMKNSIEGEPSLNIDGPADRTEEQRLVAGADVAPNAGPSLDELVAEAALAEEAEIAADPVPSAPVDALAGAATVIAPAPQITAEPEQPQGLQIAMRLPTRKPNLGPSSGRQQIVDNTPATPALAPETRTTLPRVRQQVEPAIARVRTPALAPVNQNQLAQPAPQVPTNPGVQRVRVPPQPLGDAQVQLGAYPTPEEVRGRWAAIKARNPDILGQLGLQVLPVRTTGGQQLYRMRVGPLRDTVRAAQLCQALAGRGVDCHVPRR